MSRVKYDLCWKMWTKWHSFLIAEFVLSAVSSNVLFLDISNIFETQEIRQRMIKWTRPGFHDRALSSPHLLHTKPNLQLLILHESPPRMAEIPISFTRAVRRFRTFYWSCGTMKLTHWLLTPHRWYCSWMLGRKTWNSHKKTMRDY